MKYDAPQVDRLAAEFVLGTLQAAARRRFVRLMTERADVRFAVWRWERHLNGFASGLVPQKPPQRVWRNIRRLINPAQPLRTAFLQRWRGFWLAAHAAAAVVWLAITLVPVPGADRMAIFSGPNAEALWVISADLDRNVLQTEAVNAQAAGADSSFELWVLQAEGPPLSLGLLNIEPGSVEIPLSGELANALGSAASLAISLEPAGGSPTGLPTGPIVYQASLVSIQS